MFHPLHTTLPRPEKMNNPFFYEPDALCLMAAEQVKGLVAQHETWREEVAQGKMFGVLVVERPTHHGTELGYLAAFSGQLGGKATWEGFVPPVFDYLQPDGYFKIHEREISEINAQLSEMERNPLLNELKTRIANEQETAEMELNAYRKMMAEAKNEREDKRRRGATAEEQAAMVAESQFQKAELRRLKQRIKAQIECLQAELNVQEKAMTDLKNKRKRLSDALQRWLFQQFEVLNARGERRNLLDIFAPTPQRTPPAGTGECCAPKLLQHAFVMGYRPLSMAEFWLGRSPKTEIRREGAFYPACLGKCGPTLGFMLQGLAVQCVPQKPIDREALRVVYEDDGLVVVCKPHGMLSVPGRNGGTSVAQLMRERYPDADSPLVVHRLDQDTSGLMLIAKTKEMHRTLQLAFENHEVKKRYVAVLDGLLSPEKQRGEISLPLNSNYLDRPRQMVDWLNGKPAVTRYEVIGHEMGRTIVALYPLTGRTHQLRVHCAHPDGLNLPILGDPLYGRKADRMYLHAEVIEVEKLGLRVEDDKRFHLQPLSKEGGE